MAMHYSGYESITLCNITAGVPVGLQYDSLNMPLSEQGAAQWLCFCAKFKYSRNECQSVHFMDFTLEKHIQEKYKNIK